MSKKRRHLAFIEKLTYKIFLFFFKKISVLKKSATEALMKDLPDLNMFNSLLKFHDCVIIDIMTPRMKICAVDIDSSKQTIIEKVKNTNHTKIPVYKNNVDYIVGFFYVKDIIFNVDKDFNLKHIMQSVIFVPPSMKTTNLFTKMKSSKSYLAIVLDEYDGTDGLISMTDLIEEMIPNFDNEELNSEYTILKLPNNKFEVSAIILIKDIGSVDIYFNQRYIEAIWTKDKKEIANLS
ncbi:CBS domain-containing protein [Wolbachia endosymbiont of Pentalonia nigronervosa]|uniref:CBS domain-containing protein n=1 Tax=Wolbachia endosymbiont of Pentalonia nigronervosa TaxID=1301914 RepID=UPI0016600161|nr:CBS domain-containing protein [Wolbachia endosymbiont of Pentalonia nigronervosa]MBD0391957.1 CBS domain-containing protein [Wolbachia endosymbiont of Pentalonia nigronervosa]